VLGQLTGEDQTDGGLDLSGRDGGLLVVSGKLGGLGGDALEDVCRKGMLEKLMIAKRARSDYKTRGTYR
jgi:hypothetical protein